MTTQQPPRTAPRAATAAMGRQFDNQAKRGDSYAAYDTVGTATESCTG